jgi:hypothetical protein
MSPVPQAWYGIQGGTGVGVQGRGGATGGQAGSGDEGQERWVRSSTQHTVFPTAVCMLSAV